MMAISGSAHPTHMLDSRDDRGNATSAPAAMRTNGPRAILIRLWTVDRLMTGTGAFLLALLVPISIGLVIDAREIGGALAWLKPAKFALSTGVYALTLAWVFSYLGDWPRTRRLVGRVTAAALLLEVALISLQAGRGTTSHFNVSTPLDSAIFAIMGVAIFAQTATSVAVAAALWRHSFADRALGWALRLGMTITIVGALVGGIMTGPTEAQLAEARASGRLALAGSHTVGAPDGGPGLPVTGWSTLYGDLRVPHFVGLHALQVLPLVTLVAFRRRDDAARTRLTLAFGTAYGLVFVALLLQALWGLPLIPVA